MSIRENSCGIPFVDSEPLERWKRQQEQADQERAEYKRQQQQQAQQREQSAVDGVRTEMYSLIAEVRAEMAAKDALLHEAISEALAEICEDIGNGVEKTARRIESSFWTAERLGSPLYAGSGVLFDCPLCGDRPVPRRMRSWNWRAEAILDRE